MKIRAVIHVMPWEIDHLFLLQHQLKRSSYYLAENDNFEMDVVLNLSDKLIDWNESKLDKQFFIDKYKSTQYLTDWATCRYTIFEGDEMYGHLDLMRNCIEDDIKCDSYMSIVPDIHFHETLLYYMFRSMDVIPDDYYWVSAQIPKMWDESWDSLVHDKFIDISYEEHRKIDAYEIEGVVRDNMKNISIIENKGNKKWACWFDLHSAKLLELVGLPEGWVGYGPMDTFYIQMSDIFNGYNVLDFKHYIINNEIIADRWKCVDKKDDDPAPWNHSQETPLRSFYQNNLSLKDTKNAQRKAIMSNLEQSVVNTVNKIFEKLGDDRRFKYEQ